MTSYEIVSFQGIFLWGGGWWLEAKEERGTKGEVIKKSILWDTYSYMAARVCVKKCLQFW